MEFRENQGILRSIRENEGHKRDFLQNQGSFKFCVVLFQGNEFLHTVSLGVAHPQLSPHPRTTNC